jgi:outer membrane protein OmpA-like peptidoglycan-associated protein/ABC-type nitrate/sulfonate/bicarbonate transport system substrate-binding protein
MTHIRAAALILVLGVGALVAYYFLAPLLEERRQLATSDAQGTRGTIAIGVDSWVGYFPLCSPLMKRNMRQAGYLLKCLDDSADYAKRMAALRAGELDFAVATVDSYLLAGAPESFPATIAMVIDESKGGDAIVARKDRFKRIEDLRTAKELRVAYTPRSPSEHLLKSVTAHFDLDALRDRKGPWRLETKGSEEARTRLEAGEADVAVLWEPDVSRALADARFTKLLGSEDTEKLIVDILLVRREVSSDRPEVVRELLSQYFRALKHYRETPDELRTDVAAALNLPAEQVDTMLKSVRWASLQDNALAWFGLAVQGQDSRDGIIDAIEGAVEILVTAGDFASSPIPDGDPYRILYSEPIEQLFSGRMFGTASGETPDGSLTRGFDALSASDWDGLRPIGTLKVRPITFQSGTAQLSLEGKRELDKAAENLSHYPNFRVVVAGHTGLRGDAEENRRLSQERADSVARYLQVTYTVDEDRLRALGKGAAEPLPQQAGESARSYNYRLPRVELLLVAEAY